MIKRIELPLQVQTRTAFSKPETEEEYIVVHGGKRLQGEVELTGAKNAVLGMIPAALLCEGTVVIENVPHILDVEQFNNILRKLGASVEFKNNTLTIDSSGLKGFDCTKAREEIGSMRASLYLNGVLLSKYKECIVPLPGGCDIDDRKVDQHVKAFTSLGAQKLEDGITSKEQQLHFKADRLKGAEIFIDKSSVGATINAMLCSVLINGETTIITNAAKEPHIVDIANFLNMMGANIIGAGTETIKVTGVEKLHGGTYTVVNDQIVAGTYMIAAAATEGDVLIKGAIPHHMHSLTLKLREMGIQVEIEPKGIRVRGKKPFKAISVATETYPGFPTDLQQPLGALMCIAQGFSQIEERVMMRRFEYLKQLSKMGAKVDTQEGKPLAWIEGVSELHGANVEITDLRAGAALVIAALVADGTTLISNTELIDRGYENLEENLRNLGADIYRCKVKNG